MEIEAASQEPHPAGRRPARLVVSAGKANIEELDLTKARTNIGREVDVYRDTSHDWFGCPLRPDVCGSLASAALPSPQDTTNVIINFGIIV